MKCSISTKYNMEFYMVKAGKTDTLVNNEVLWINSQKVSCLVPVEIDKDGISLSYNVTGFIPLKKYVKKKIQINDFILTYSSIIKGILELTKNGLDYRKILVDDKSIYVNPITRKCKFIFIPYAGYCNEYDIKTILRNTVNAAHFESKEDEAHAKDIYSKVEMQYTMSWDFLEQYVRELEQDEKDSYNKIRIMHETGKLNQEMAQAQMQNGMEDIKEKFCPECGHKCKVEMRFCTQCGNRFSDEFMFGHLETPVQPQAAAPVPEEIAAVPHMPEQYSAPVPQPQVNISQPQVNIPQPQMTAPQPPVVPQVEMEGSSYGASYVVPEPPVMNTFAESDESDTTVLGGFDDYDDEATTVLSPVSRVVYPKLTRQKTQEVIEVNKDTFIIGKGKASDYIVSDNSAISRSHLTVITKDGRYYVSDNGSTNHTYINDEELVPQTEYEISDGTVVKIADEEFVVNI